MKRMISTMVLLVLAAAMLPARGADKPPYEIPVIAGFTGNGAFVAQGVQTALKAGENYINATGGINGRPVHFVMVDDQTNPVQTVQIMNQMISRGVPAVLGPTGSATCEAALPIIVSHSAPVSYCLSNTIHPPDQGFMFSAQVETRDFLAASLRYLKAKGVKKVAMLVATDQAGIDGEQTIRENLSKPEFRDMEIVDDEHFGVPDLAVTAQMARIKASGAQVIDAWVTGPPLGMILREAQQANYEGYILTHGGNINSRLMGQYAAWVSDNLIFGAPPYMANGSTPAVVAAKAVFKEQLRKAGVETPDVTHNLAWDPMLILVDALRHLPDNPSAEQVHTYIEKLRGFAGISGVYDFRRNSQRGLDRGTAVMVRWDKASGIFITLSKPGGMPL